jgi:MOSC domain-containing protein YiiM
LTLQDCDGKKASTFINWETFVSALPHISGLFVSQGGVPKTAVSAGIIGPTGLLNDKVKHTKIHGGLNRALCLFSADQLHALQAEGHPLQPGWVGENVLIANLNWSLLDIGHVLHLGSSVQVQVTDHTEPCNQIAAAFTNRDFRRIKHTLHPGWSRLYVRVLAEGALSVGDLVLIA